MSIFSKKRLQLVYLSSQWRIPPLLTTEFLEKKNLLGLLQRQEDELGFSVPSSAPNYKVTGFQFLTCKIVIGHGILQGFFSSKCLHFKNAVILINQCYLNPSSTEQQFPDVTFQRCWVDKLEVKFYEMILMNCNKFFSIGIK